MAVDRPKLQDVADLADVSIGTASRVLNNKPNVLPDTRARVLNAASRLGYQAQGRNPAQTAQALSTIGVLATLIPDEYALSNPFYGSVIDGVDRECREQNLKLMYAGIRAVDHDDPAHWPPMLHDPDVHGLLVMGHVPEHVICNISQRTRKPLVLVDAHAPAGMYDMVLPDNIRTGYDATRYLIEQGHRHIGLIGSHTQTLPSFVARRTGYLQALRAYGIDNVYIEDSAHTDEHTYEASLRLLRRAPQITAILAVFDFAANSAIRAARHLGLTVPGDVSVMGIDDVAAARSMVPPLTTMFIDKQLMGMLGVRQLLDRVQNPDRVVLTVLVRTRLVERESVRAL